MKKLIYKTTIQNSRGISKEFYDVGDKKSFFILKAL